MFTSWKRSWNVLVIKACEATMAAKIEMIKAGQNIPGGTELKNGLEYADG